MLLLLITVLLISITLAAVWLTERNENIVLKGTEHVLITGCDSGIGFALAQHLQKGTARTDAFFQVIATCLHPDGESATKLKSLGVKILALDFTKDDMKTFSRQVNELVGHSKLHGVVNNAGVCIMGEFDWFTDDQIDCIFKVNMGSIRLVKALLPRIVADQTRVINVTSVNGTVAYPGLAIYCSSKYALEGFSDSLAMELAKFGVYVIKFRLGDFAKITSIMSGQKRHASKMWHHFTEEQRQFYGDYFHAYQEAVTKQAGGMSVTKFTNLMNSFNAALLSVRPRQLYTSGSATYLGALWALSWAPEGWRNSFIAWLFKKAMQTQGVPSRNWNRKDLSDTSQM